MNNHKKQININKIIKSNSNVNASQLADNLKMIGELQKNGINVGPNYSLSSPYSRPNPHDGSFKTIGSILHAEPPKKM